MTSGPFPFVAALTISVDDNLYTVTTNRITHRHQWRDIHNELQWHPSDLLTCEFPRRCRGGGCEQEIYRFPHITFRSNHVDTPLIGSEDDLDITRTSHGNTNSKMHTPGHIGGYREGTIGSQPFMQSVHRWYIVLAEYIWHIVQEHE